MISEDCLSVRLSEYLEARRGRAPEGDATAEDEPEARDGTDDEADPEAQPEER